MAKAAEHTWGEFCPPVIAGRYELGEVISRSPRAWSFRGKHLRLGKRVQIKLLDHGVADGQEGRFRLRREARLAARLDHPNCGAVYDFGVEKGGQFFVVSEWTEGHSLRGLLARRQQPLPWQASLLIARQVLRGLIAAHEQGVIHQDVCTDTVCLVPLATGAVQVKLVDFGVGAAFESTLTHVSGEFSLAQLQQRQAFIAPERQSAKERPAPSWDIFSVGRIVSESCDLQATGVPEALKVAIEKATAIDPAERFPSARAFFQALEAIAVTPSRDWLAALLGQRVKTKKSVAPRPLWQKVEKLWASAAVMVLPVLMAGLALCYAASQYGSPASAPEKTTTAEAKPAAPPPPESDVQRLTRVAQSGATPEERDAAFAELQELGQSERVHRAAMLALDVEQLPTCKARREAVLQLAKTLDPVGLPALQTALERKDNRCLRSAAAEAMSALGGRPPDHLRSDRALSDARKGKQRR